MFIVKHSDLDLAQPYNEPFGQLSPCDSTYATSDSTGSAMVSLSRSQGSSCSPSNHSLASRRVSPTINHLGRPSLLRRDHRHTLNASGPSDIRRPPCHPWPLSLPYHTIFGLSMARPVTLRALTWIIYPSGIWRISVLGCHSVPILSSRLSFSPNQMTPQAVLPPLHRPNHLRWKRHPNRRNCWNSIVCPRTIFQPVWISSVLFCVGTIRTASPQDSCSGTSSTVRRT